MLTLLPASYRPSSLSTSDTILFVMRDKKRGQGKTPIVSGQLSRVPSENLRCHRCKLSGGAFAGEPAADFGGLSPVAVPQPTWRPSSGFAHFSPALRRSASQRSCRAGSL